MKPIIYVYVFFWSYLGSPELVQRVQAKYFEKSGSKELPLIRAVVNNDWSQVINCVAINSNWKEALVAALTYAEQGTIHILRSHFKGGRGLRKCRFLLTFSTIFMLKYMRGSEKNNFAYF